MKLGKLAGLKLYIYMCIFIISLKGRKQLTCRKITRVNLREMRRGGYYSKK